MNQHEALKKYFGYDCFKEGQEEIIKRLLEGKDCLAIMPTGGGKSICYQLASLLLPGLTLVISPLIALMKDQVDDLTENGIPATVINSTLTQAEIKGRLSMAMEGKIKLLYVAPERLEMLKGNHKLDISMIAVDEAHCISQWGHDFRPSYRNIASYVSSIAKRPIIAAFTATATKMVIQEIKELLKLRNPYEKTTGFDRPNLFYKVVKPKDKWAFLKGYLEDVTPNSCGIIYCSTRKSVESVYKKLYEKKFDVGMYHGGMETEDRECIQNHFMSGKIKIIVATNAFGMGIDKPDVRFVIHYNMPGNMEAYYQEAGRAGRDGLNSECVLMYSPSDIVKQKLLISSEGVTLKRQEVLYENLMYLVNYCHTEQCLRKSIVSYFGESKASATCNTCSNCTDDTPREDVTIPAQKLLSCVYRTRERFGLSTIIQVLRGSKNAKIIQWHLNEQSTYGIMKDWSEGGIRELAMHLIASGYLDMTTDQFPLLKLNSESKAILKGEKTVLIRKHQMEKEIKNMSQKKSTIAYDQSLYEQLVTLRKKISEEKKIPPYVIFHNTTLEEMALNMPENQADFLQIKGVGERKFETYGELFLNTIETFRRSS